MRWSKEGEGEGEIRFAQEQDSIEGVEGDRGVDLIGFGGRAGFGIRVGFEVGLGFGFALRAGEGGFDGSFF